ncbi:Vesicle-associated protein 1-2 [Apostasia shenzhenica]|uniref:Vesicle-associated protein 1-2 n=1 Tax=Apostasia shenzhenica TaxID=1088818 RepID=A0A2H9ZT62_9ASPA|nr:Vesicle-associated protein 1-2 [Apostasia shenzhenica]
MQAQREAPPDMQCKDKFLVQSVVVNPGTTAKDITSEMFSRDSGNKFDEVRLRVIYVSPPQPPSPVHEGSDEGSSPRASVNENGNLDISEPVVLSREDVAHQMSSTETMSLISRLTEERNAAMQLSNKLREEIELVKREMSKQRGGGGGGGGGFSLIFVAVIALLGILVGYLVKA